MKKISLLIILISAFGYAQVGVGTVNPDSTLDIVAKNATGSSTNVDGILIPRVDRQRAQSMTSIITSTMIYVNSIATGTATGTAANITSTGFYYYDGSVWQKIITGASATTNWALAGNASTTPGTDFLGTTGTQDIRIKTNNTDRWNISDTNSGQLQSYSLGSATAPIYSFQPNTNTGIYSSSSNNLDFSTNGAARFRIPNANQIHALSLGTAALPFYSFSTDTGIGMWSPTTSTLSFSTAGIERMRIDNVGKVGIGGTPSTTLDIVATNSTGTTTNVDGILIPRVDRQRAQSMTGITTGTMIYVNSVATGTASGITINVVAVGFYYYDGSAWIGMNNTTGQSSTSYFSTGSLSAVTSGSGFTLIPGLTATVSVPANCNVLITADVGISTNSTSATGFSATDIALIVDGSTLTNGGYRRIYTVNSQANQFASQQASISQSLTLAAGSHTVGLYAAGAGLGGSSALVGGASSSAFQGELTITIIKK